jgi:hypothetical protein
MQIPARILFLQSLFTFEGEAARADGLDSTRNPYREGSQEYASWFKGWLTPDRLPDKLT